MEVIKLTDKGVKQAIINYILIKFKDLKGNKNIIRKEREYDF